MISEVMVAINNYFVADTFSGSWVIADGAITLPESIQDGQYFRISGSVFNDGVYQYPAPPGVLHDENFTGEIALLAPPRDFLRVCDEIATYEQQTGSQASGFTSESFGGYSYTRATNPDGTLQSWADVYASKLKRWRRLKC